MTFEDYCRAIRQAQVQFILTRRATDPWWLRFVATESVTIQFGSDGGASIADGAISDTNYFLIGRHHVSETEIVCNGEWLLPQDFVLLPPASRFLFAGSASRTWLAVSVPQHTMDAICDRRVQRRIGKGQACVIPVSEEHRTRLVELSEALEHHTNIRADPSETGATTRRLTETIRSILSEGSHEARSYPENVKAMEIVANSLDVLRKLDSHDDLYVDDLARAANVHPRTLLRAFHQVVRMGPVRYLRYYQLNQLRRQLCNTNGALTVTEIMQAVGVSDMGRISGAYRALFGETPSETLRSRKQNTLVQI